MGSAPQGTAGPASREATSYAQKERERGPTWPPLGLLRELLAMTTKYSESYFSFCFSLLIFK